MCFCEANRQKICRKWPNRVSPDKIERSGEPVGIRTRDLLIKSQLLYQLSYRPTLGAT